MDRPSTSKPRGICKYYTHAQGCFAGKNCKFLHGGDATLTPFDAAKVCKYYGQGFCKRGEKCWFLHELPNKLESSSSAFASSGGGGETEDICGICLEKPTTYGILGGCSHIFCVACLRSWRDPAGRAGDVVVSNTKKCPMCRVDSRFITPSSQFFPLGHVGREKVIENYKASMARIRCRHFDISMAKHPNKPTCPFGKSCFYKHLNLDGTPHNLSKAIGGNRHNRTPNTDFINHLPAEMIQNIMGNNQLEEISATIDAIRESLPILEGSLERSRTDTTERDAMALNFTHLERLADQMLESLSTMRVSDEDSGVGTQTQSRQTESGGGERTDPADDTPRATTPPDLSLVEASNNTAGEPFNGHWSVANALANLTLDIAHRLSEVQRIRENAREAQSAVNRIAESLGSTETVNVDSRQEPEEFALSSPNDGTGDTDEPWSFDSDFPGSNTEVPGLDVTEWSYGGGNGWSSPSILARSSTDWNTGLESPVPSVLYSDQQNRSPWSPNSFQPSESVEGVRTSNSTPVAAPTSRFGTVVGREAERFLIDLDDDDGDEISGQDDDAVYTTVAEKPSTAEPVILPGGVVQEASTSLPSASKPPSRAGSPAVGSGHSRIFAPSEGAANVTAPPPLASEEPPFVTDGRGRVVWSSTSNAGREGPRGRRNKSKSKRPTVSEAGAVADGACPLSGLAVEEASSASEHLGSTD